MFEESSILDEKELMNKIYSYGPFPLRGLAELREKFTFNITPFQQQMHATLEQKRAKRNYDGNEDKGLSSLKLSNPDDDGKVGELVKLDDDERKNNDEDDVE